MPLSLQHYVQIVATKNTVTRQGRAVATAAKRIFWRLERINLSKEKQHVIQAENS